MKNIEWDEETLAIYCNVLMFVIICIDGKDEFEINFSAEKYLMFLLNACNMTEEEAHAYIKMTDESMNFLEKERLEKQNSSQGSDDQNYN